MSGCWNCKNGLVIAQKDDYGNPDAVCVMCGRPQNLLQCLDPTPQEESDKRELEILRLTARRSKNKKVQRTA